jgi:HPt (histidine-containing phosphotransfer) domain-containing protein
MSVYEKTLKLLPGGIEKCIVNLDNFLAANDMHNFSIEAHSIKTSLANLGAMELSAKAHELENSSARNDAGFCASALQLFSEALHKLGNELENAFSEHQQNKDFIIPPELVLILTRMKDAFLRMEFVEINNELHNLETISLCDTLEREIEEIKDAVMVMDYSGATEMIQKLLHDT